MTRPSDHYPRRCGCGHRAADPAINDHPISLRDDLDRLTKTVQPRDIRVKLSADSLAPDEVQAMRELLAAPGLQHLDTLTEFVNLLREPRLILHRSRQGAEQALKDGQPILISDGTRGPHLRDHRVKVGRDRIEIHDDSSTDAARAGIPDAAPTVEADTPERAGIGVEDATTPAPSTSDDIVSISLAGDRELVELVAALVIGGVK